MRSKKIPVLFIDSAECCGCTACFAICAAKAIEMRTNCEGFLYPVIDIERCTGCNKCLSVCPTKPKFSACDD